MANLIRKAKKALAARYKQAKIDGYWNDSHIDQGFIEKRARQALFREQVRNGERTPESGMWFGLELAKQCTKIRYRDL